MRKLLNVPEIADILGLGQSTVYTWAKTGRIPALRIGHRWRFDPDKIEAWLAEQGDKEKP